MQELNWDQAITLASPHSYTLVSTMDPGGKPNLMGVGWWTIVSWSPQMVAIAIAPKRYTKECLDHCPEFALCFPSVDQAEGAWLCGCESGRDVDKWEKGGFVAVPSRHIQPPVFEGATLAMECRVNNRVECGDHFLYIADVLAIQGTPENRMHLYSVHYREPVGIDGELNVKKNLGPTR